MTISTATFNALMKSRGLTPVPKPKQPRGDGFRSSHEKLYALMLDAMQHAGEIDWYGYETIRLRLAGGRCTYTPDFAIIEKGALRFIEVKGWSRSLATGIVKVKVAAEHFPWRFTLARWRDGVWNYQDLPGLIDRIEPAGKAGAA